MSRRVWALRPGGGGDPGGLRRLVPQGAWLATLEAPRLDAPTAERACRPTRRSDEPALAGPGVAGAQKKAQSEGRASVWGDESGCYLLPGLVRTSAPGGQPPVLRAACTRAHGAAISGLTLGGRPHALRRHGALDSLASVLFLKHLLPHVSEKWLVIWDGSPIHKGPVRTVLAAGGARQSPVEPLPPYAPDLNPGDGVWHRLKHVDMRHRCGLHLGHLRCELGRASKRRRRKPQVLTACVAQAGLSLETSAVHATLGHLSLTGEALQTWVSGQKVKSCMQRSVTLRSCGMAEQAETMVGSQS